MSKMVDEVPAFTYRAPYQDPAGFALLVGTLFGNAGVKEQVRRLPHHAFVIVLNGYGTYRDETGARLSVGPGNAIRVVPGLAHHYGPNPQSDWDELYAIYDGPFFDSWHASPAMRQDSTVLKTQVDPNAIIRLAESLESSKTPLGAAAHLLGFMAESVSLPESQAIAKPWPEGEEARSSLSADLQKPIDLKILAAKLGMSYGTFRHRFTAEYGESPYAYRLNERLKLAKSLLQMTGAGMEEVAQHCGFADAYHFSAAFKRKTGQSPTAYRQEIRKLG